MNCNCENESQYLCCMCHLALCDDCMSMSEDYNLSYICDSCKERYEDVAEEIIKEETRFDLEMRGAFP